MILTPHLLVGAAIGAHVHNFWAVFILGFLGHFLTDLIPHWDYVDNLNTEIKNKFISFTIKALIDFSFGFFIIVYFFWSSPFKYYILFGALVSVLPDFFVLARYLMHTLYDRHWPILEKYNLFHTKFHIFNDKRFFWRGLICEILFTALAAFFLFK